MKLESLYRMDKEEGIIFIDIDLDFYRDIYNEWDFSPIVKRDLDNNLLDYLEECVSEIPKNKEMKIVMHLPESIRNHEREKKTIKGFDTHLNYQIRKIRTSRKILLKKMIINLIFGITFVILGNVIQRELDLNGYLDFINEGINIGGWVLIWEFFSTLFFQQSDISYRKKIYQRLSEAEISFEYHK